MEFPSGHHSHSHSHHHKQRDDDDDDNYEEKREDNYNYPPPGRTTIPGFDDQPPPPPPRPHSYYQEDEQPPPPPTHLSHTYHAPPPPQEYGYSAYPSESAPPPPIYSSSTHVEHVAYDVNPSEVEAETHHSHRPHLPSFLHHQTPQNPTSDLYNKPTYKIFSKAEPNFSLTNRDGHVILTPSDPSDEFQVFFFLWSGCFSLLFFHVGLLFIMCFCESLVYSTGTKMKSTAQEWRMKRGFPALLWLTRPLVRLLSTLLELLIL